MFGRSEMAEIRAWRGPCIGMDMFKRIARLFTIKTKFEVFLVVYGLAVGAVERGVHYTQQYPGAGGWVLFAACTTAVFMAGAKMLEAVERDT